MKFGNAIQIAIVQRWPKFEVKWFIRKGVESEKPERSSWTFTN